VDMTSGHGSESSTGGGNRAVTRNFDQDRPANNKTSTQRLRTPLPAFQSSQHNNPPGPNRPAVGPPSTCTRKVLPTTMPPSCMYYSCPITPGQAIFEI